jgi:signal transduction histidine kinase/CheY-like chemotaxis protein
LSICRTLLLPLLLLSLFIAEESAAREKAPEGIHLQLFTPVSGDTGSPPVRWQEVAHKSVYLGRNKQGSWVRVDLNNKLSAPGSFLVEIAATEIHHAELFFLADDGTVTPFSPTTENSEPEGKEHTFSDRAIRYRNLVFPVSLAGNSTTRLLFRIDHAYEVKPEFRVWDRATFQKSSHQELVFFGMIYGALAMIILYNLFIYLTLREKNHLLFVLFGAFTGLFISMQEGHFYQFVAPESVWPKDISYAITLALMSISFTFFTISFLDVERWSAWLVRLMLFAGAISAFFLALLGSIPEPVIFSHYSLLILVFLYTVATGISIYVRNQGVAPAGFFSLAIFLCTLGLIAEFIAHLPGIPWTQLTYSFASLGNAAMALVFAFALADKMRILQNEKINASMKLVKMSEEKAQSMLDIYKARLHEIEAEKEANEIKIENRAKSDFFATMSHEIRTPMNGVLGMTELLADTELEQKQKHYVASINSSAKALLNAINDLLDYTRIESGQMELESRLFNLEKIVDDCIDIFSLRASEIRINFLGQIHPETPLQLKGDANKIRQVILNLLGNSFNFNNRSDISIHVFPTGKATMNSREIRFEITSTGFLLDEKDRESLFATHQDLSTSERKHHGHEMGLAVSRQLVELMQGQIGADTDAERKTTTLWFTVRLLLPHKNEEKELPDRSKILGGRRMLVCDTNPEFIQAVEKTAQSWGMKTSSVTQTQDVARKLLGDEKAYQVLMIAEECLTPEVQLAVRQSNLEHSFITSIILTTRTRFSISADEMKRRGIQFVLEKPHTTETLYLSLLKSMGVEKMEKENPEQDRPLSILLAEDNNVNLMVLEGMLRKMRFQPLSANDGKQALDSYTQASTPFDLIIMDCEMPEMDGYDATRAIRASEKAQREHPVIIGLSAHSSNEYRDKALAAGMDSFLIKPVTVDDLQNVIDEIRSGAFHAKRNGRQQDYNQPILE